MTNTSAPGPGVNSGVSKRRKKHRGPVRLWLDRRYIRTGKALRRLFFPLYRALGIKSILAVVIPGYRQVSKSPGGLALRGAFRNLSTLTPTIAVIGDYGSGKDVSYQVRDMVVDQGSHAVVTLGDNVYYETGFQALVGNLYGDYLEAGAFFPAAGNHDYSEGRGIVLFDRFFDFLHGHRWYSVSFDDVEFFILDSHQALHHPDVFDRQRTWLESAVTTSSARWKIVVLHHPPHSARSRSQHEFRFPFDKWGVCMVMSGHDHTLQHLPIDGVHYVVNGIGGGSTHEFEEILEGTEFRLSGQYGAVFVDVKPDVLGVRFMTVPGKVVHSFEIPAPTSAVVAGA
jgi:tartrate-resistant acid phosphatase type 5